MCFAVPAIILAGHLISGREGRFNACIGIMTGAQVLSMLRRKRDRHQLPDRGPLN